MDAKKKQFSGVWTALVTPFNAQKEIDWAAFNGLLKKQEEAKITGLVLCGTTGEASTLSTQEKLSLIRRAKAQVGHNLKIMAGGTGQSTQQSVEFAKLAQEAGADSLLVVTPPYNKPNFSGLKKHFALIAAAFQKEVCLYHVPARTGLRLTASEMTEIAEIPNITLIKEASGDICLFSQTVQESSGTKVLSGDDPSFLASLSVGGQGIISVTANIFPSAMLALYNAYREGQVEKALKIHQALSKMYEILFCETNPCPIKEALCLQKLCSNELRLPLASVSQTNSERIQKTLNKTLQELEQPLFLT